MYVIFCEVVQMSKKRNPEETREKILDVSFQLFKERGYEKTTILDIVDGLEGLTRGAFYHHFKSKEDVLYALLEQRANPEKELKIVQNPELVGLEKIKTLMIHYCVSHFYFDADGAALSHIWLDLLKDPRFLAEQVKEIQIEKAQWLMVLVEEGMADGSIKKQDPQILTELILLLLNFWMIPTIYKSRDHVAHKQKLLTIKAILDNLGCPLLDEEELKVLTDTVFKYNEHAN